MNDSRLSEALKVFEYYTTGLWTEIPARFQSTFRGEVFQECDLCGKELRQEGMKYMIGKYYQDGQLKQESCLCFDCRGEIRQGYSKESEQIMGAFFSKEKKHERLDWASNLKKARLEKMIAACLQCGRSKEEVGNYFEYGLCVADRFLFYLHPYLHCEECIGQMVMSLSDQTNQFRERYYAQYYGLPPSDGLKVERKPLELLLF